MAFVSSGVVGARVQHERDVTCRRCVAMSAEKPSVSRREALATLVGVGVGSIAQAAGAIQGGFVFPKAGFNAGSIKPGDIPLDQETLKSKDVQAKLQDLRQLREKVQKLAEDFANNSQLDVVGRVSGLVDISTLRDDLNTINTVFDEETQIKTDRVVRAVIQDISDLKGVAVLKPNQERSPKKADNTKGKIVKLAGDMDKLLQFYP
eukprot:Plantae.Rhodophyta-Purpureofilum_apyrenoidigerum.ctg26654.p1 GENE.Plantae.Rhodophyta-Purpureofilum_apyrenoidigerum.ctg26654~~Plantae.Rhodophyta-Purpureofilum_apyrenoidigerum.ctg26654.p1  ORF type:complete len:206 (+),score=49.81 Plantae.Rhodophyta-Purpureofilum_apyrenoidigerum.ctg26654:137-754(+)